MRLWLPKVRWRNIRLSEKGENKPSGNCGALLEKKKGGSRHGGGRENKRPGCRREPEKNVHAPVLNSKNNSSEVPIPVQGATTCPSTYVRCSE